MGEKLTVAQERFLKTLAGPPEPTRFSWMTRTSDGRLIDAEGPPENWTHFRVTAQLSPKHIRMATITSEEHFDLADRGYTKACAITPAGRAALQDQQ
jgi:hypothetical protein